MSLPSLESATGLSPAYYGIAIRSFASFGIADIWWPDVDLNQRFRVFQARTSPSKFSGQKTLHHCSVSVGVTDGTRTRVARNHNPVPKPLSHSHHREKRKMGWQDSNLHRPDSESGAQPLGDTPTGNLNIGGDGRTRTYTDQNQSLVPSH